ncbi:hypothetical protein [Streptomyces sp. NPDC091217]|uniref:hypothetical protein n=1 Tax=Streptomyces sp. NPDC091217 TaxID=3365975 RepID=UPI00382B63BF
MAVLVRDFLAVKSRADVDGTMAYFSRDALPVHAELAQRLQVLPTRILGDSTSALVFYTDTPGMFGPSEIRAAVVLDFRQGKIAREVDYWDGRHFGVSETAKLRLPEADFPKDFRESTVGEGAASTMTDVSHRLAGALWDGDGTLAAELFAPDAVFEDIPAHVQIVGPRSIGSFITDAASLLPYAGAGTAVRHVVGSAMGGGYEWTSSDGPVPHGVIALELNRWQKISRLTAMWDGSLVEESTLVSLARTAIER